MMVVRIGKMQLCIDTDIIRQLACLQTVPDIMICKEPSIVFPKWLTYVFVYRDTKALRTFQLGTIESIVPS
jgi:hypothetical protein